MSTNSNSYKIAILSSLIDGTGNKTTASRLCTYLRNASCEVHLCDIEHFQETQTLKAFVLKHDIHAIIGIHILKAGALLIDLHIPCVLIAGGTDLNVSVKDRCAMNKMTSAVEKSKHLVVFTDSARKIALETWPSIQSKLILQPQCVTTSQSSFSFTDLFRENGYGDVDLSNSRIFLVVGGIRKVKDPLYVAETVAQMHRLDSSVRLVIVGPELDVDFARDCREKVRGMEGVHLFPMQPPAHVHGLMQQCFALVNSSLSEGMCGAILEAMHLGTPVIARRNEGNLSIVSDSVTGMIYTTCQEFKDISSLLLSDETLRNNLIENGKRYVAEFHNSEKEEQLYVNLVKNIIDSSPE